ncbi:hypothetical protein AAFF_G00147240 [Aldrovandia affinis]|uniref:ribonuclease H n=1 Tax=Aldrovandia affinis TaxID=143900 RepID=A0AAD7W8Q2_9TELE|nr:hypothetical protein AAFF_G00147240 [Aldrovandia affinis]
MHYRPGLDDVMECLRRCPPSGALVWRPGRSPPVRPLSEASSLPDCGLAHHRPACTARRHPTARWFSSLDLQSGYWEVELTPDAWPKTAFTIGQGLWQFRIMPFGLCNAPATFEQLMERVLNHVPKQHCIICLDDLLVHAGDFEGALRHLWEVFAAIHQAGLCLNPKKWQLFWRESAFLEHVVSTDGMATDPAKIAAVRNWSPPTNINDLQSFLGLASYYRRYVQDFATIARPLHRLTDHGQPYVWDDPCAQAFNASKRLPPSSRLLCWRTPTPTGHSSLTRMPAMWLTTSDGCRNA